MKDYLLCVDSDGCAIDGMTIKHLKCFGPCLIPVFSRVSAAVADNKDWLLREWNRFNLYSRTRGINRFKGLLAILKTCLEKGWLELDIAPLENWVNTTDELSNKSLEAEIAKTGGEVAAPHVLLLAREWSLAVNKSVADLALSEKKAFSGVAECFAAAKPSFDIAVVSSANAQAVEDEWSANGIYSYTDEVMTQEHGSKYDCIMRMLGKGYNPEKVLMVGDAPGDQAAAEKAGVLYFPITPTKEVESWGTLKDRVLGLVEAGTYRETAMQTYTDEYFAILDSLEKTE